MSSKISERLVSERKRLGLNQDELAQIGGVARSAQANYEAGKRAADTGYLSAAAAAGIDVQYVVTGARAREIDLTLFGVCEAALRQAYSKRRGDMPEHPAFRASQVCKLYNSVVRSLKPEDHVGMAANNAAESLVAFADDPDNPAQLDRVLLHPAVSAPAASAQTTGGVNVSGSGNRVAGRDFIKNSTIQRKK